MDRLRSMWPDQASGAALRPRRRRSARPRPRCVTVQTLRLRMDPQRDYGDLLRAIRRPVMTMIATRHPEG